MTNLKVLLISEWWPVAICQYWRKAFMACRNLDVMTAGKYNMPHGLQGWGKPGDFMYPEYAYVPDVITPGRRGEPIDLALKPLKDQGWQPDLVIQIDSVYYMSGKPPCKQARILVDPHCIVYHDHLDNDDMVFNMQRAYMKEQKADQYPQEWLPYAYSRYDHYVQDGITWESRTIDATCIGLQYDQRKLALTALAALGYETFCELGLIYDEYRAVYNRSKIAFVYPSRRDTIARHFEGMAMGCLTVSKYTPDMGRFPFISGRDYIGFSTIEEAVDKMDYYLRHPDEMRRIAERGHRCITQTGHTYDHRVRQLLTTMGLPYKGPAEEIPMATKARRKKRTPTSKRVLTPKRTSLVTVVIPTWNHKETLERCLSTLFAHHSGRKDFEVIVFVQEGTDDTIGYLHELMKDHDDLYYVYSKHNAGYAVACNVGAQHARGDIVIWANDDIEFQGDCIQRTKLALIETPKSIVGEFLVDPGLHGQVRPPQEADQKFNNTLDGQIVEYLQGHWIAFVRDRVLSDFGGFDTRYAPVGFDDVDLCFFAREKGYQIKEVALPLVHYYGTTGWNATYDHDALSRIAKMKFQLKVAAHRGESLTQYFPLVTPQAVRSGKVTLPSVESVPQSVDSVPQSVDSSVDSSIDNGVIQIPAILTPDHVSAVDDSLHREDEWLANWLTRCHIHGPATAKDQDHYYNVTNLCLRLADLDTRKMTVLDVGCGLNGSPVSAHLTHVPCQTLISNDVDGRYLTWLEKRLSFACEDHVYLQCSMTELAEHIKGQVDIVLFMDALEHIEKQAGIDLLAALETVTRRRIIVWIPTGHATGRPVPNAAWAHRAVWFNDDFRALGYRVEVYEDFHSQHYDGQRVDVCWAIKDLS